MPHRQPPAPATSAEPAANGKGPANGARPRLDRPRRIVQAGVLNPLITAAFRLVPGVYDFLVGPMMQQLAIANDDVPPTEGNVFQSRPELNATEGRWRSI